jgi:acetyl esterase/lipase
MKRFALTAALVALLSTTAAAAQPGATRTKPTAARASTVQRTSYVYAINGGQTLELDRIVDPSAKVTGKRPVIIFSFGGGWEGGKRNDAGGAPYANYLASLGYNVIAIDYRLGIKIAKDRKEFTASNGTQMYLRAIQWGVEDLFDATSFVVKHAAAWNIDPNQIVIMGGSSGATDSLVAEYNVANETDLAKAHLPAGFRYAGVISMAGAFWLPANTPLTFKNKPAPIMFFHGAKDQVVTYDEVQGPFSGYGPVAYFRKFPGPDTPKWFVDYPQGDHLIAGFPIIDERKEMEAFLQKLVKERQQVSIHTVEEDAIPKIFQNAAKLLPQPAK